MNQLAKKTEPLKKRHPDEADPNHIITCLNDLGHGRPTPELDLEEVLARASDWHLEYWLEMPRELWTVPEVYDAVLDALGERGDTTHSSLEFRAMAIGERIKAFKRNLHLVALEYVEIGRQLAELKGTLSQGHGGSRHHIATGKGWQALCKDCVGISWRTADRYIEDAEAYAVLKASAEKNPRLKDYLDMVESGETRAARALSAAENYASARPMDIDPNDWASLHESLEPGTPKVWLREMEQAALSGDELAAFNLTRAAAGEVPMGRAYAGWKGGTATKGKNRADPDPAKIVVKAAVSINRYWAKLNELDIDRRRLVQDTFLALMSDETMPEDIARESYQILKKRLGAK